MGRVRELADSIREIGLQQPPVVRRVKTIRFGKEVDAYEIMIGGHRIMACRQLEMLEVPCVVLEVGDLQAELIEIDENLIREQLTAVQTASAISRRKEIYEILHPETAHGGDRKSSSRQIGNLRFTKATAEATGKPERTVQRAAARGKIIGDDNLKRIEGACLDNGVELDALIKLSPDDREALIAKAEAGEDVTARPKDPEDSGVERQVSALMSAWGKASHEARAQFVSKAKCCEGIIVPPRQRRSRNAA
jgi:ParB-like chromosome segregation protein Spo0J